MGINRVKDHKAKLRIQLSKRWPDGSRFRRFFPNITLAKNTLARMEAAIAEGTWREIKEELSHSPQKPTSVAEFSQIFLEQHCQVRMRSWKRYGLSFKTLNRELGKIPLEGFRRQHLHGYVQKRAKEVQPNTVNRDIACIKKMFSFALEIGTIEYHPLVRFPLLPVDEVAFRVMTIEEFRDLVDAMDRPSIAALVAIMGETGIRKGEALDLKWDNLDLRNRILGVEHTKSRKVRHIRLSDYAIEWLFKTVRYLNCPYVFVSPKTGTRWINPEKSFRRGRQNAGLDWVGFHDLRRFRATQWVMRGVDLRTVKELLGHADIKTTMRYAHFASGHALQSVQNAHESEARELKESGRKAGQRFDGSEG